MRSSVHPVMAQPAWYRRLPARYLLSVARGRHLEHATQRQRAEGAVPSIGNALNAITSYLLKIASAVRAGIGQTSHQGVSNPNRSLALQLNNYAKSTRRWRKRLLGCSKRTSGSLPMQRRRRKHLRERLPLLPRPPRRAAAGDDAAAACADAIDLQIQQPQDVLAETQASSETSRSLLFPREGQYQEAVDCLKRELEQLWAKKCELLSVSL